MQHVPLVLLLLLLISCVVSVHRVVTKWRACLLASSSHIFLGGDDNLAGVGVNVDGEIEEEMELVVIQSLNAMRLELLDMPSKRADI